MSANTAARHAIRLSLLSVLVLAISTATASAQSGRATVRGLIVDESGAVLSGVEVTATHIGTNVVTTTRSSDAGVYSLVNLPIGRYTLTFKKQGFATETRQGVDLGVAQVVTEDIVLTIGTIADVVTVSASAKVLETGNAEIGTTMKSGIVEELPLTITGGRALENFAYALTPSVEGDWWESRIAGGATFSKEVVIDGTSAVAQIGGHIGEGSPPIEAVEEFKVQTSGIQAEYGRTEAASSTSRSSPVRTSFTAPATGISETRRSTRTRGRTISSVSRRPRTIRRSPAGASAGRS